MANELSADGHDVVVITRTPSGFGHQPISPSVELMQLYVPRGPKPVRNLQLPALVASLRKRIALFGPDVVIGSRWDCAILSLLAAKPLPVPVISWEHVYLPLSELNWQWRILRRLTYERLSAMVVVNRASVEPAQRLVDRSKIHFIPYFIEHDDDAPTAGSKWREFRGEPPQRKLLALGRLERQKGFDLLIECYARITRDFPDWGLMIVGRGSQHSRLEHQIQRTGLQGRVQLVGPVADPTATFADSDAFVFPSRYEGLGLALVEAMWAGLPVVSFDCPAGPGEFIEDEVNGLLVPHLDTDGLTAALRRVMSDADLRARLGARARAIKPRFSKENVMPLWEQVLSSVVAQSDGVSR